MVAGVRALNRSDALADPRTPGKRCSQESHPERVPETFSTRRREEREGETKNMALSARDSLFAPSREKDSQNVIRRVPKRWLSGMEVSLPLHRPVVLQAYRGGLSKSARRPF